MRVGRVRGHRGHQHVLPQVGQPDDGLPGGGAQADNVGAVDGRRRVGGHLDVERERLERGEPSRVAGSQGRGADHDALPRPEGAA